MRLYKNGYASAAILAASISGARDFWRRAKANRFQSAIGDGDSGNRRPAGCPSGRIFHHI